MTGADLDDGALAEVAERVGDTVPGGIVDEEVLSQLRLAYFMHRPILCTDQG